LELCPGCHHRGDIQALRVQISRQATLEGVLKMPDSKPSPPANSVFERNRKKFAVAIILLFLAGAGTTTAIRKIPGFWRSLENRASRVANLAWSFRRQTSPGIPSAELSRRQEALIEEALQYEREGKVPNAVELLKKAAGSGGKKSQLAEFRLAQVFARQGKSGDAIARLGNLLKKDPGHMGGMILLGDLHAGAGRYRKAAYAYADAIRHDPVDMVLRRRLAKVRARLGGGKLSDARAKNIPSMARLIDEVERLLSEKKPAEAAKVVRKGISVLPNEPRLYYQLGTALTEIADRKGAIEAYERVIGLAPDWLDAYVRLGALLEASRRDLEAVTLYRKAAALHPSNLDMLTRIPLLEKRRGRRDKAYRMLLKMKKEHPDSTIILLELGTLLWESGKVEESKAVFRRALELDPQAAPALNRLAWFHVMDGKDIERGIEYSRRSLDVRPDTPPYLDTLAELYYKSGQPVKSIQLIQRAIELEPSNRYYRVQLDKFKRASR
jgi:tetratricopeptide (TPR) repeat protein